MLMDASFLPSQRTLQGRRGGFILQNSVKGVSVAPEVLLFKTI